VAAPQQQQLAKQQQQQMPKQQWQVQGGLLLSAPCLLGLCHPGCQLLTGYTPCQLP
jgi:hypothetical protein